MSDPDESKITPRARARCVRLRAARLRARGPLVVPQVRRSGPQPDRAGPGGRQVRRAQGHPRHRERASTKHRNRWSASFGSSARHPTKHAPASNLRHAPTSVQHDRRRTASAPTRRPAVRVVPTARVVDRSGHARHSRLRRACRPHRSCLASRASPPDELEAVRDYEAGTRGRKTILNKIAQLQSS